MPGKSEMLSSELDLWEIRVLEILDDVLVPADPRSITIIVAT